MKDKVSLLKIKNPYKIYDYVDDTLKFYSPKYNWMMWFNDPNKAFLFSKKQTGADVL
jgi:hypothetical protein